MSAVGAARERTAIGRAARATLRASMMARTEQNDSARRQRGRHSSCPALQGFVRCHLVQRKPLRRSVASCARSARADLRVDRARASILPLWLLPVYRRPAHAARLSAALPRWTRRSTSRCKVRPCAPRPAAYGVRPWHGVMCCALSESSVRGRGDRRGLRPQRPKPTLLARRACGDRSAAGRARGGAAGWRRASEWRQGAQRKLARSLRV